MTCTVFLWPYSPLMMALHFCDKTSLEIQRKAKERIVPFSCSVCSCLESLGLSSNWAGCWPWMTAYPIRQCKEERDRDTADAWAQFYTVTCMEVWEVQDNPHIALCPPGIHGEIRLLAENGQSGEDVEETMVCFKKWTNHVLQVSGKSLR